MIRRFEHADIAPTMALRLSVHENVLSDPSLVTHESVANATSTTGRGWVWDEAGAILGFSIALLDSDNGGPRIWALFVSPGHERRGIGRALLDEAVAWLWSQDVRRIHLSTDPGTRAERFYLESGWQPGRTLENGEIEFSLERPTQT